MDTTSCILGIICLVAPPFFAMLATQGLYSLVRGNGFGHPCRLGFGIGMVGFLPMLLIVLGIKADAFFPELGGTDERNEIHGREQQASRPRSRGED